MRDELSTRLPEAVFQTVAYADLFDHPLTAPEIHRYLIGVQVSFEILEKALKMMGGITKKEGYFTLPGRDGILSIRRQRVACSRNLLPHALRYGRILGAMPFIRMVALTGSLAVLNVSKTDDFDYMLVTVPGRVWIGRTFALLLNRAVRALGHTICPNLIVSEKALEWPLHDLYSARELCQMIPISGRDTYQKLIHANTWAMQFLPNAFMESISPPPERTTSIQPLMEFPLSGSLGDRFERWEMNRKIDRFSRQEGFGDETVFNADVCQGNFHHHRKWTREAFENRLRSISEISGSLNDSQDPTQNNVPNPVTAGAQLS
jgi:hypothetical protein